MSFPEKTMKELLESKWLKAAVAGSLWASFEIIAGSFLHNLRIPFSGTMLASFSIILLVGFLQIWPVKGLIWRAGIICGLMKSLSPSAVILGPMTGIMMEAFILEGVILLMGRNIPGYLVGGSMALLSALLHKLINLLILYGKDIVRIYVNLFEFFRKQLNIQDIEPVDLFYWIIFSYMAAGALSAVIGYLIGKTALKKTSGLTFNGTIQKSSKDQWDDVQPGQKFYALLLLLHLVSIPSILIILNKSGLTWFIILIMVLYILLCSLYYKRILSRLAKPLLWIQFLLVTLLAGIFWDPPEQFTGHFNNGFIVGLEMILRAVFIIASFSGLSVELRNPRIKNLLFRIGFKKPYMALSLAFNSLPAVLERVSNIKTFFRNPFQSVSSLLIDADQWFISFKNKLEQEIYPDSK
jgi:hypothetical protein